MNDHIDIEKSRGFLVNSHLIMNISSPRGMRFSLYHGECYADISLFLTM
jgi:hypothetical protein